VLALHRRFWPAAYPPTFRSGTCAPPSSGIDCERISKWADAHANLPTRARWIAQADVVPLGEQPSGCSVGPPVTRRVALFSGSDPDSVVPPTMVQAYRETHYKVFAQPGSTEIAFTLRIDEPCPELLAAHRRRRTRVTTCAS
jgi:hypothetical protein